MFSFSTLYTVQKSLVEFALRGMPTLPSPAHIASACTHTSLTCTSASHTKLSYCCFITGARCYAERGYEIACRPSVCPSVCNV